MKTLALCMIIPFISIVAMPTFESYIEPHIKYQKELNEYREVSDIKEDTQYMDEDKLPFVGNLYNDDAMFIGNYYIDDRTIHVSYNIEDFDMARDIYENKETYINRYKIKYNTEDVYISSRDIHIRMKDNYLSQEDKYEILEEIIDHAHNQN